MRNINKRHILHIDMDAFFASIEQRDNPDYRLKPVIIGSDPKKGKGRGVVSTCSYEARAFGIHSAMPISIAYKKCPDAIFLPVNMDKYIEISCQIYNILKSFTPDVEAISIDEAFLDITGTYHLRFGKISGGTPENICILIKKTVYQKTGLKASIGLAHNKMIAKIASDHCKPDGFLSIPPEKAKDFLHPLNIRSIWGLGNKSELALNKIGIFTIGQLASADKEYLVKFFGANSLNYWELANGIDVRAVKSDEKMKSFSNEHTFEEDTNNERMIESALMNLCESVSNRMRLLKKTCRTVSLKIRLSDFKTYIRSKTIQDPTNLVDALYNIIKELYNEFISRTRSVRLVGVKASNITDFSQKILFENENDIKSEHIHSAVDRIKIKFGSEAIGRASGIKISQTRKEI